MSDHPGVYHFQVLFEAALEDYERQTGITLANHPFAEQLQSCQSADSVIALLQEQVQALDKLGESDKIMGSLKNVVSVLSKISATTAFGQSFGTSFPPTDAINTSLGVLLTAFEGVSSDLKSVIELLQSIESFMMRLDIYTKVPPTPVMTEMIVKIMVELLSTLALVTNQIKQGGPKKFVKKFFGENDVNAVLQRLDRLTQDEARTTAAQTLEIVYGLFQNMRVVMDDGEASAENIRNALEILQQMASEMNKSKHEKLQQNIRSWLSPPDSYKNYNTSRESRHAGTAGWFTGGNTLSEWKSSGPNSLLWIHGKPGAGKSVLCSAIIENIMSLKNSGLASLAFFYCDFREDGKRDLRGLLSSVLVQLCHQPDSFYHILSKFYSDHADGSQHPGNDELVQCLKDILGVTGRAPVYLIVDGLDECPNTPAMPSPREKVLMFLQDLTNSSLPNLRICVTSRPEIDIRDVLEPLAFHSISLHDENGQMEDIETYIKSVVSTDPKIRRWSTPDKKLVIDVLIEKSDGMFQWVHCQIAYLRRCLPGRIRHALNELPETLDGTYDRALRDIDEANWESAHRLLQCVAVASRPLHVKELAEMLSFDFNTGPIPRFHEGWRLEDPIDAVLSTTPSLLAIVDGWGSPVIQFSHFSVKEFLTSTRLAETNDVICRRYHISLTPAHTLIAQACLGILLHLDINVVTRDSIGEYPLVEYAARHWVDHARFEGVSGNVEDGMECLFDPNKPHLAIWVWIHDPEWSGWDQGSGEERPLQPRESPLHYAVVCGLHTIVEFLIIQHAQDLHSRCVDDALAALHLAAREGREDVTRVLLKHGAEITSQANDGSTPLHLAAQEGCEGVARVLLEHGADIASKTNDGSTPLHLATREGREDVARVLLERDADITSKTNSGSTPLHLAAREGREDVARILLQHDAEITSQTNDGSTPLHLAAREGHEDVARVLLEHGADVTSQTNDGSTPLHLAAREGREDVARILLEQGADIASRTTDGSTPSHIAAREGREDVARVLLEHGADVTSQTNDGSTLLHLAVREGREDVAHVLLECGADITSKTNDGSTPLHLAAREGREVAYVLLERGAETASQTNDGSTPLHLAAREGREDVARVLLEHGADLTSLTNDGSSPLHLAAREGHEDLVRVLLEYGADLTFLTNDGSSPLHLASQRGHEGVTSLLLKRGADATDRTNDGSTPLHLASQCGYEGIVFLLLAYGAYATAQTYDGTTALHLASEKGHCQIAYQLLQHGADATARTNDGSTPLHIASKWGVEDVVLLLLERGANASAETIDGSTPLTLALEWRREAVTHLLLEH